ncbi:acyltransferase [Andreprevotia chitinilytica]|uniref:acyltransferase n=1 Tax=Andreprevotia chitinilytica TaxID=396808 RepID=UPI0005502449|nr:acyltransferase [Andreprevotia chitinilytica]
MACTYENIYPVRPDVPLASAGTVVDALANHGLQIGEGTIFVDVPRVAFTQVTDEDAAEVRMDVNDFSGAIRIGSGCYIESGFNPAFHSQVVKLTSVKVNDGAPGQITIGNNVVLQGVAIVAYDKVEIGDDVIFGPLVTIMDSSGHPVRGRGQAGEASRIKSAPVKIGNGAWIGTGAMIMKGVEIGEGSVIGARSVVYDSVPANCVAVGNPARVVKEL